MNFYNCMDRCIPGSVPMPAPVTPAPTTPAPITPVPTTPIVPALPCERGGCFSEICGFGASALDTVCELPFGCEDGCTRRFQTCGLDAVGNCDWHTIIGEEGRYERCIQSCNPNSLLV